MRSLIIFYSRADENYFGGAYRYIEVGNTEKAAKVIALLGAGYMETAIVKRIRNMCCRCMR